MRRHVCSIVLALQIPFEDLAHEIEALFFRKPAAQQHRPHLIKRHQRLLAHIHCCKQRREEVSDAR
jgi:hypothetical protein